MSNLSNTVAVPFCYLSNSKAQVFDLLTTFRSKFQIETLLQISKREDFAYFVTMLHNRKQWLMYDEELKCKCACSISFFTKDGAMQVVKIGQKRILRTWDSSSNSTPVALDRVVYTSRCN